MAATCAAVGGAGYYLGKLTPVILLPERIGGGDRWKD